MRRTPAVLAIALGAIVLATACGSDSSSDADATTTTAPPETSASESASDDGPAPVTREALIAALEEEFAETPPSTLPGQAAGEWASCWADGLLASVGEARLAELDVTEGGVFSPAVLREVVDDVDEAATYLAPMFECTDIRPTILGDLEGFPADEASCIADAVLADREVRLIFVVGTRGDQELSADWQALRDDYDAILTSCTS